MLPARRSAGPRMGLPDHVLGNGRESSLAPLLRPNDVARMLAVSRAWVYDAARTGRIPSVRLGGEDGPLRFIAEDIERWLAETRAGWLPGQSRRGSTADPSNDGAKSSDRASGSVVHIRGQQSML
jgi:excisionase family DNA binding protein